MTTTEATNRFCRECERPLEDTDARVLLVTKAEKHYVHARCLAGIIARTENLEDRAILQAIYQEWRLNENH
jgi:hypothetical protein